MLLSGCRTSHTYQAGDAVVHEKRVHFSLLASAPYFYRVELPTIPLNDTKQYHFSVRRSPNVIQLTHLFMSLPQGDGHEDKKSTATLPWECAILSLAFTEPTGELIYSNRFRLGSLKWTFSQGDLKRKSWAHADRVFGWFAWSDLGELKAKLGTKTDYDTAISVEVPSARRRDFIQLRGEEVPDYQGYSRK